MTGTIELLIQARIGVFVSGFASTFMVAPTTAYPTTDVCDLLLEPRFNAHARGTSATRHPHVST